MNIFLNKDNKNKIIKIEKLFYNKKNIIENKK